MRTPKFQPKNTNPNNDLGFGNQSISKYNRFLNKDGSVNIRRISNRLSDSIDFFHTLITMSWTKFFILVICSYCIVNILFACVYSFIGVAGFGNLSDEGGWHNFYELFFFSAQTLTTVGYGYIYPKTIAASTVAAIESMFGLLGFALATGILYGRFSRPKSGIVYSKNVLVSPYKDITAIMFRIANSKQNELIESEAQVIISMKDLTNDTRLFQPLSLERTKLNFLTLNWTIVHPIDAESPLYGFTEEDYQQADVEFIILIKAINDTYSQTVYSRNSYKYDELIYGAKFTAIKRKTTSKGFSTMNILQLDDFEKVPLAKSVEL